MVLMLLLLAMGGNGSAPRRGVQGGGRGGLVGPSKECFICLSVRLHSGECGGSLIQSRTHTTERKNSESFTSFLIKPHSITEHTIKQSRNFEILETIFIMLGEHTSKMWLNSKLPTAKKFGFMDS